MKTFCSPYRSLFRTHSFGFSLIERSQNRNFKLVCRGHSHHFIILNVQKDLTKNGFINKQTKIKTRFNVFTENDSHYFAIRGEIFLTLNSRANYKNDSLLSKRDVPWKYVGIDTPKSWCPLETLASCGLIRSRWFSRVKLLWRTFHTHKHDHSCTWRSKIFGKQNVSESSCFPITEYLRLSILCWTFFPSFHLPILVELGRHLIEYFKEKCSYFSSVFSVTLPWNLFTGATMSKNSK